MARIKGSLLSGTSITNADNEQEWLQGVYLTDKTGNATSTLPAGADRSGTAGTTSAQLAAANPSRRGLNIQNISANNIGVNEVGGAAAIGSPGTYTVAAGASFNVRTNQLVNVVAAAANSAYTATEF